MAMSEVGSEWKAIEEQGVGHGQQHPDSIHTESGIHSDIRKCEWILTCLSSAATCLFPIT